MSNLRALAIRKASTLPKGDNTRSQLIELAHKHAAGYAITDNGLEKTKSGLHIQPNTILYYGASSSPSEIIVTRVTEDMIYFKINNGRGFTDSRDARWVFEDLAISGSQTWLRGRGKRFPEEASNIKRMLDGKPGKTIDVGAYIRGMERVKVEVEATQPKGTYPRGDAWYAAEEYGGVGGRSEGPGMDQVRKLQEKAEKLQEGASYNSPEADQAAKLWAESYALEATQKMIYVINTDRQRLEQLQKDNRFKVLKVQSA